MKDDTRPLSADRSEVARPADDQAGRALLNQDRPTAAGRPAVRVSDPLTLVKLAADALTTLRGCVLTVTVARVLADVLAIDFPTVPRADLVDLVAPRMHMGSVLDDNLIDERARQIATVAVGTR